MTRWNPPNDWQSRQGIIVKAVYHLRLHAANSLLALSSY